MEPWTILVLYAAIGGLFKVIEGLDENDSYLGCVAGGIVCGVLAGFLITEHKISTLILGGVIIGFLVSGRLSNIGYYFGVGSVLTMILYYGAPPISLGYLLIIAGAAFLDEVLAVHESQGLVGKISVFHPVINLLLAVFLVLGVVPFLGVVAFIVSEMAYRLGAVAF